MTKLSKTQLEVLRLMNSGWKLERSVSTFLGYGWHLQKEMKIQTVNSATAHKLWELELIEKPNLNVEFPIEHWTLTEKGKEALK